MDTVVRFGKYNNLSFEEVLNKDVNYCIWLTTLRFTNTHNDVFIQWLKSGHLEVKLNTIKNEKVQKEMARVVL